MHNEQSLESRLVDLEIRMTHQEAALEEMTRVLLAQEQLVRRQAESLERIEAQLRSLQAASTGPLEDEPPPPHY
jgi:SlyX protein